VADEQTVRTPVSGALRRSAVVTVLRAPSPAATLRAVDALVLDGGLAGGFDLLDGNSSGPAHHTGPLLKPRVLGGSAVLTGALPTAQTCVESWLHAQLARA
jgi:hypothetical protein